jgi:hypothetical protein
MVYIDDERKYGEELARTNWPETAEISYHERIYKVAKKYLTHCLSFSGLRIVISRITSSKLDQLLSDSSRPTFSPFM